MVLIHVEGTLEKVHELIGLLNVAPQPSNLKLVTEEGSAEYRLATGDQYLIQTASLREVENLLWGMLLVVFGSPDLRWIRNNLKSQLTPTSI